MASAVPMDISSTDSEDLDLWEIDNYKGDDSPIRDTASSINDEIPPSQAFSPCHNFTGHNGLSREDPSSKRRIVQYESPVGDIISSSSTSILPSWAASPHPNSTGYNDPFCKDYPSFSKRQTVHDAIPSRLQKRLSIAETAGSSSSRIDNNIQQKVGSNNLGPSEPMERALPASIQPFTSNPRSHNLIENVGASEICETYGKSAWSNPSNGGRLLPSTFMPGKYSSTTPFVGLNDSFHQTGVSEERPAGPDESFIFQAAVQIVVGVGL